MASSTPSQPDVRPGDGEFERFGGVLYYLTPRVFVTYLLIAANVGIFAWMIVRGVHWLMPGALELLAWGANHRANVVGGEWWRLVTCMFLHVGVLHLAANLWGLYLLGPMVERFVGNTGMVLLYLISGISGSLATLYWRPEAVSAGASGAVFGLMGGLLGFVVLRRDSVPRPFFGELLRGGLLFVVVNVAIGFSVTFIDNAAHLGGLGSGLLCGLLLSQPLTPAAKRRRFLRNGLVAVLGAAGLFAAAWYLPQPLEQLLAVQERTYAIYEEAADRYRMREIDGAAFADVIERRILPPWRAARLRLASQPQLPPGNEEEVRQLLLQSVELREKAWEVQAKGLRRDDRRLIQPADELRQQADAFVRRINRMRF